MRTSVKVAISVSNKEKQAELQVHASDFFLQQRPKEKLLRVDANRISLNCSMRIVALSFNIDFVALRK